MIETLVAITVLVSSIVAPLTIASSSLFQARSARDQVTATYLAQEAIEMIHYIKDRNLMKGIASPGSNWLEYLPDNKWFAPDWGGISGGNMKICSNPSDPESCPYLKYNTAYNLASGDNSKFKRAVIIKKNPSFSDEATIEARVYWFSGAGTGSRYVSIKSRIYNWAVVED